MSTNDPVFFDVQIQYVKKQLFTEKTAFIIIVLICLHRNLSQHTHRSMLQQIAVFTRSNVRAALAVRDTACPQRGNILDPQQGSVTDTRVPFNSSSVREI